MGITRTDGAGGGANGVEARTAQAVNGGTGNRRWQAGQQNGHACDVAVVLTSLVGASNNAVIQGVPVDAGVARGQGADRVGGEIVGPHIAQGAGITADRGTGEVADVCFGHGRVSLGLWFRHVQAIAFIPALTGVNTDSPAAPPRYADARVKPGHRLLSHLRLLLV